MKRTNSDNDDFQILISKLDDELWNKMMEDQVTYDQYNKVPGLETVIIAYENDHPVGCGCFKKYDNKTVEIKRMFVVPEKRKKGVAAAILQELETWAKELDHAVAILETGKKMINAHYLYRANGYSIIENFHPYIGMPESICFKKKLT